MIPDDQELTRVVSAIRNLDVDGRRMSHVIRYTFDQLYDGQRTRRYRWDQLYKTEKTHCGTLIEINIQRAFDFTDGQKLDYSIDGVEVDCKFSQSGSWMIPPEAQGHICLVISAEDTANAKWSAGLIRALPEYLNVGGNRDGKCTLNSTGRNSIVWLHQDASFPPNTLLQLDRKTVDYLITLKSGQMRVNELFRIAQKMRIGRGVVATVAQQEDYMKRVRGNGGARSALKREGIIILGQYSKHQEIARALGIPVPARGESVSVRVAPAKTRGPGVAEIADGLWRIASKTDSIVTAPPLPKISREKIENGP